MNFRIIEPNELIKLEKQNWEAVEKLSAKQSSAVLCYLCGSLRFDGTFHQALKDALQQPALYRKNRIV